MAPSLPLDPIDGPTPPRWYMNGGPKQIRLERNPLEIILQALEPNSVPSATVCPSLSFARSPTPAALRNCTDSHRRFRFT
uniref:Uncharacterized protein n=1 Tax=Oryza glumipatula TaxID=40148 RepID=A0A0E0AW08_9ORYZ